MNRKIFSFTVTTALFAAMFTSCNKDDDDLATSAFDGKIVAVVENGSAYNSLISKVVAYVETEDLYEEIAFGSYSNGGFILTLPSTPNSKFLMPIEDRLGGKISDRNAMICYISPHRFEAYNSNNELVDYLLYGFTILNETYSTFRSSFFVYVDRDVTVTGSENDGDYPFNFTISLKMGWNTLYNLENGYSTKADSRVKWYFDDDIGWW